MSCDVPEELEKITCGVCKGKGKTPNYRRCNTCRGEGEVGPWSESGGQRCPSSRCGEGRDGLPGQRGQHIDSVSVCDECNGHGHHYRVAKPKG